MREIISHNKDDKYISLIGERMTQIIISKKNDDSIRIDTVVSLLPTTLPLNKAVIYSAMTDSFSYKLTVTRTNLTNIDCYYEINKVKKYSGKVILRPDSEIGLGCSNFYEPGKGQQCCDLYLDEKFYSTYLIAKGDCDIDICISEFDNGIKAIVGSGCLDSNGKKTVKFNSPVLYKE
jgi:hypothetical protein